MKKSILTLVVFMLLGLSFAKAQLVTMYDLTYIDLKVRDYNIKSSFNLDAPSQNISIAFITTETMRQAGFGSMQKVLQTRVSFGTIIFDKTSSGGTQFEDGLWTKKVGNRTHLVRVDSGKKKYVYAFFDDVVCPQPIDEFNKKLQEKGF